MSESNGSSGGIGFAGLLGLVFVTLKLCHVINWSWLWVLAPFWIGIAVFLILLGGGLLIAGIASLLFGIFFRKKK